MAEEKEASGYTQYHISVDKGQSSLRIDKFLMQRLQNASRTKIQEAIHREGVLVNGQAIKKKLYGAAS